MKHYFAAVLAAALLAAAPVPRAGSSAPHSIRTRINDLIRKSGADVAVAVRTLDGRDELLIQPDVEYHAASTMKVPVMIELFRQVRAGTLTLDDQVPVVNEFHSIVDGSPFKLDLGDDSDDEVYKRVGGRMSYRDLCEAMITVSSNFATNLIIEHLGARNIQKTTDALGAQGMHVLRGVEDDKAFQKGLNNSTTARALLTLMEKIAKGEAVDKASSDDMVAILKRQKFNNRIPAGLPPGTPVAHKTGEITRIQHDAAIVYAGRPFVIVILVRGLDDPKQGSALAADITRVVYAELNPGVAGDAGDAGRSAIGQAASSKAADNRTATLLKELIRIDTSNPPGLEGQIDELRAFQDARARSAGSIPRGRGQPYLFQAGTDAGAWRSRGVPVYGIYPRRGQASLGHQGRRAPAIDLAASSTRSGR
jgi:beta-lactamase class A